VAVSKFGKEMQREFSGIICAEKLKAWDTYGLMEGVLGDGFCFACMMDIEESFSNAIRFLSLH
jgi:hypothetical protein